MESINIADELGLTIFLGAITAMAGSLTFLFIHVIVLRERSKRDYVKYLIFGCLITILTWPLSIYQTKIETTQLDPQYVWNYYGFPFPIHASHDYFPLLTMSAVSTPVFWGLFLNIVIYSILGFVIMKRR